MKNEHVTLVILLFCTCILLSINFNQRISNRKQSLNIAITYNILSVLSRLGKVRVELGNFLKTLNKNVKEQ